MNRSLAWRKLKACCFNLNASEVESEPLNINIESMTQSEETLRCSFCGKPRTEVRKLLAAPKAHICNECVDLCVTLLANSARQEGVGLDELLPGSYADRPWPTPGLY